MIAAVCLNKDWLGQPTTIASCADPLERALRIERLYRYSVAYGDLPMCVAGVWNMELDSVAAQKRVQAWNARPNALVHVLS